MARAKAMAKAGPEPTITMKAPLTMSQAMDQVGTSGLKRMGAQVLEEFLPELRGATGRAKYREMAANDPTIKRGLRAIKWEMLRPEWRVEGGDGPNIEQAREFLASCLDDMSDTWRETLREALTCVDFGASWCQMIYKKRVGPNQTDAKRRSKYTDGLIGWRKWSFRGQETWYGWEWDENGDVSGLIQLDPYTADGAVTIPIDQSLHFKVDGRQGDPEGESILRSAYRPYRLKKQIEISEAIRAERDATGVPHFAVQDGGPNLWDPTDANMANLLAYLEKAGTALRLDEQTCVITPAGIVFTLVGSPGSPQVDSDKTIRRLDWQILGSMLAQFLELGQSAHGSFGKSESDQDFFLMALEGILTYNIAETINRFEVPRLFAMNAGTFGSLTELPRLVPGELQSANIGDMAEPLAKLIAAGAITPDASLEAWLRQRGKLPEADSQADGEGLVGKALGTARKLLRRPAGGDDHDQYTVHDILGGDDE
jgi:hypothetical protein